MLLLIIGYSLCIQPSISNTRTFQPLDNNELFLTPTWNQFRSLKEFTACIIHSDQISFAYFIISCSSLIQKLPKFQHFIKSKAIDLPPDCLSQNICLPYPLTSPLQLLCQASFWESMITLYFTNFHPICPLFSIQSFDQNTASPSLLSAMYFCAYQFSKSQEKEVLEYMEKLAVQNIKKILKNTTMDNVRALVIHTFMAQWGGKLALAKSLQAHLSRMSYLLGLHLDCGKLSPIDRYNRNLIFCIVRTANIGISGSQNFSPNYLTEFGDEEVNLYDSKWQLPNPNSPIYFENPLENELYSLSLTRFFKFTDISAKTIWFPSFYNKEINTFNSMWNSKMNTIKIVFEDSIRYMEELKLIYPDFKHRIEPFETQVKMAYHEAVIEMYEVLKHKNKLLQPENVTTILNHCHQLYQVVITADNYNPYFQFFAHIIGLHYLNIYSRCTESQKLTTKKRLLDLILFVKNKFLKDFSLNYLILKTGYDSLDDI